MKSTAPVMSKLPTDPNLEARARAAGATGFPAPETIYTRDHRVMCDGGGGALGHPLVYMDMGADDFVECGYCDRRFVLSTVTRPENEYLSPGARGPEAH